MTRVLLAEDDAALARGVVALLKANGHAVDHVGTGAAVLSMEKAAPCSLIILDIGLPDRSGFDVLQQLRQRGLKTPVLILTARDGVEDRVKGLDLGGDDYLLKPFDPQELLARVRALLRRGQGDPSPLLVVGSLSCDRSSGEAFVNGRALDLRRREWAVLQALLTRVGKIVPRERLIAEVFELGDDVAPNALETYVARLRKKLQPDGPRIRVVRGIGYVLDP